MSAAKPLVTVCTTTYNRPTLLPILIDSVLAQTEPRWQMVVCDNSENDDTARVMQRYTDPRIRYFKNETNLGMGRNALKAFGFVDTPYFTFTPDDDVWEPENLARKTGFLERHRDVDAVFSNAHRIGPKGEPLRPFRTTLFAGDRRIPATELRPAIGHEKRYFVNILTGCLRADPLLKVFRESYHLNTEEYLMWFLGCRGRDIGFIGERLVRIREADHYRVVQHRGRLIDFKSNAGYRQRQLLDFCRTLSIMHPEIDAELRTKDVQRFVAGAIVSRATSVVDLVRGVGLSLTGIDGVDVRQTLALAAKKLATLALPARKPAADPSGIGPVARTDAEVVVE